MSRRAPMDAMVDAGAVVAEALREVVERAKPGTTTVDRYELARVPGA